MKSKLLLLIFLCYFLTIKAQQPSGFRFGVETGIMPIEGKFGDRWEFRQVRNDYSVYERYTDNDDAIGDGEVVFGGIRAEFPIRAERITLSSGLRFTHINGRISSINSSRLYLYHPSQQGIELFRINKITESHGYVTISFEADLVLFGYHRLWQLYVKAGIQAGLKIYGTKEIDFVSSEMKQYEDEIFTTSGKRTSNFMSSAYGSLGLRYSFKNQLRIAVELFMPYAFITNNSTLFSLQPMTGAQLSITTPVNFLLKK